MGILRAMQIVVDEAEVSAIGENTEEHKIVLEACEKVQNLLDSLPELLDSIGELHSQALELTDFRKNSDGDLFFWLRKTKINKI